MEIKYWRKKKQRGYQRLDDSSPSTTTTTTKKKKIKRVKLDPTRKKRFFWRRFKIVPKLKILSKTTSSPKKLLTWLRDAYVNMMLRLANSRVIGSSYGYGDYGSGLVAPTREYDEKKLVEIYKSVLMAQGNLVHRDVVNLSSGSIVLSPIR